MIIGILKFVLDGKDGELPLKVGTTLRVGRAKENDLVINSTAVSRFHSSVIVSEEGAMVSDLGSTNGTFVNGRAVISPTPLRDGDRVSFGAFQAIYSAYKEVSISEAFDSSIIETHTRINQLKSKVINIMLIDIISYTSISRKFPPEEVSAVLTKWVQNMTELVGGYRGTLDKQLGDCVVAVWELVDLEKAANCAEKVIHETILFSKREWKYEKQLPWRCRVVVHQGKGLFGIGGANNNIGVSGDVVTEAKALEDLAGVIKSDVLLSESFAKKLPPNFGYMLLEKDGKKIYLKNLRS